MSSYCVATLYSDSVFETDNLTCLFLYEYTVFVFTVSIVAYKWKLCAGLPVKVDLDIWTQSIQIWLVSDSY